MKKLVKKTKPATKPEAKPATKPKQEAKAKATKPVATPKQAESKQELQPVIINLIQHPVVILDNDGNKITFSPSGKVARVSETAQSAGKLGKFSLVRKQRQDIENLPAPQKNTYYIVSGLVFDNTTRKDVIAPDSGPTAIRNEKGYIDAVRSFLTH